MRLTGTALFFVLPSDSELELIVKVINSCNTPGVESCSVLAAGLIDREVTLTVADTKTNTTKSYINPLGTLFQPIKDTSAFVTCR
jgi:hypothetical protein